MSLSDRIKTPHVLRAIDIGTDIFNRLVGESLGGLSRKQDRHGTGEHLFSHTAPVLHTRIHALNGSEELIPELNAETSAASSESTDHGGLANVMRRTRGDLISEFRIAVINDLATIFAREASMAGDGGESENGSHFLKARHTIGISSDVIANAAGIFICSLHRIEGLQCHAGGFGKDLGREKE